MSYMETIEAQFQPQQQRLQREQAAIEAEKQRLIMSTIRDWYRTRQIPKLPTDDATMMDNIIRQTLDGQYTLENLDYVYSILVSFKKLKQHIVRYREQHPEFNTDHNCQIFDKWASEHPQSDALDFNHWIESHKYDQTFTYAITVEQLAEMLRFTDKKRFADLKLQFGSEMFSAAWKLLESRIHGRSIAEATSHGQVAEAQAQKKMVQTATNVLDQMKEKGAQTRCEAIVSNFRRSANYADRDDCRKILGSIMASKSEAQNWFDIEKLLEAKATELQREKDRR